MDTILIAKLIGPVLLLRGVSILIDRRHFMSMVEGLEAEVRTITFSFFPIALMMAATALAILHRDRSSLAAILIQVIAYGGMLKGALLILFPGLVVAKARLLVQAGFLHVVWVVCILAGAYFSWFGFVGGGR